MRKLGNSKLVYNRKKRTIEKVKTNPLKKLFRGISYVIEAIGDGNRIAMSGISWALPKDKYKHKFSLRIGEVVHINGIPCEYLGSGAFTTNTYPGRPTTVPPKK